jgi:hypothetical protein
MCSSRDTHVSIKQRASASDRNRVPCMGEGFQEMLQHI